MDFGSAQGTGCKVEIGSERAIALEIGSEWQIWATVEELLELSISLRIPGKISNVRKMRIYRRPGNTEDG